MLMRREQGWLKKTLGWVKSAFGRAEPAAAPTERPEPAPEPRKHPQPKATPRKEPEPREPPKKDPEPKRAQVQEPPREPESAAALAADARFTYCEACGHAIAAGPDGRPRKACDHSAL